MLYNPFNFQSNDNWDTDGLYWHNEFYTKKPVWTSLNQFHGLQKTGPRWSGSVPAISGLVLDRLQSMVARFGGKKPDWTGLANTRYTVISPKMKGTFLVRPNVSSIVLFVLCIWISISGSQETAKFFAISTSIATIWDSVLKSSLVWFFYFKTRQLATATSIDWFRYWGTATGPLKTSPSGSTTWKKNWSRLVATGLLL